MTFTFCLVDISMSFTLKMTIINNENVVVFQFIVFSLVVCSPWQGNHKSKKTQCQMVNVHKRINSVRVD